MHLKATVSMTAIFLLAAPVATGAHPVAADVPDQTCAGLLDKGDHAFALRDYRGAQWAWRASIESCARPGPDPLLRSRALVRQASLPEFATDEERLLDLAAALLDLHNLDHSALLAEVLRRRALARIGAGDLQAAERDFRLEIELLRALHGESSGPVVMAIVELESQRILYAAPHGDGATIDSSVHALEGLLASEKASPSGDRGIQVAVTSALLEGYRAQGRSEDAKLCEAELNRLLH